jgi:hypothetical protein
MVMGIVMLMFIGFNRIWHFVYIRLEAIVGGAIEEPKAAEVSRCILEIG